MPDYSPASVADRPHAPAPAGPHAGVTVIGVVVRCSEEREVVPEEPVPETKSVVAVVIATEPEVIISVVTECEAIISVVTEALMESGAKPGMTRSTMPSTHPAMPHPPRHAPSRPHHA